MPWFTNKNPNQPGVVNNNVGGSDRVNPSPPPSWNPNNIDSHSAVLLAPAQASRTSRSREDQGQAQALAQSQAQIKQQHEIVQSKHQPRIEAPALLRSPSKQAEADSRDSGIIQGRTSEDSVHKEGLARIPSKDQSLIRGHQQSRTETNSPVALTEQYQSTTKPISKQDQDHLNDNEGPRRGPTAATIVTKELADMPKETLRQEENRPKDNGGMKKNSDAQNIPATVNLNIINYVYLPDHQRSVKNDVVEDHHRKDNQSEKNEIVKKEAATTQYSDKKKDEPSFWDCCKLCFKF